MSIEKSSIGEQHRALVKAINELYPNYFEVRKGVIYSEEVNEKLTLNDTVNLAKITSRIFNMTGASVPNINLYKLFESYFLDLDKREQINEIINKKI